MFYLLLLIMLTIILPYIAVPCKGFRLNERKYFSEAITIIALDKTALLMYCESKLKSICANANMEGNMMRDKRGRGKCALLLAAVMIAALLFSGCAEEKGPEASLTPQQEAENWVTTNYEDFYDIRNLKSTLLSEEEVDGELQYKVAVQCETKYKFESVEDMPFVKGIRDEIKDMELSETQRSAIEDYIKEIGEDADFGNYSEFTVDLVIKETKDDSSKPHQIYFCNDVGELEPVDSLKLDEDALYRDGKNAAKQILNLL